MNRHVFAIIPSVLGVILLLVGGMINNHWVTAFGAFLVFWGVLIHSNNLAQLRRAEERERNLDRIFYRHQGNRS